MFFPSRNNGLDLIPGKQVPFDSADNCVRFASALAMFGMKLKESPYMNANWDAIKKVAEKAADRSQYLQNDFLLMLEKAMDIYEPNRKKKKKNKKHSNEPKTSLNKGGQ